MAPIATWKCLGGSWDGGRGLGMIMVERPDGERLLIPLDAGNLTLMLKVGLESLGTLARLHEMQIPGTPPQPGKTWLQIQLDAIKPYFLPDGGAYFLVADSAILPPLVLIVTRDHLAALARQLPDLLRDSFHLAKGGPDGPKH